MNNDYLAPLGVLIWAIIMFSFAKYCRVQYLRQYSDDDEQLFREVYGPAGKPKKPVSAEPESPTRSAE
jgi:hypothetical protein